MSSNSSSPAISPVLVLSIGILAISSGSILVRFAQALEMPSLVIAAWRLVLASLVLLPLALMRKREEIRRMPLSSWSLALASGLLLAIHFASWISSLAYTSVTSSTVLVSTSPLWVGLLSPLVLGEQLSRPLKIGIGLALAGSLLIGGAELVAFVDGRLQFSMTQFTRQPDPVLGNALAVLGAVAAAGYLLIGRRLRAGISVLSYTAVVYSSAAFFLMIMAIGSGHQLTGYGTVAWLVLAAMAIFPQLLGHTSYNWALGFFPAALVSVVVVAEPVGATILALFIFQEIPNGLTIAGSTLLLTGIIWAARQPQVLRGKE